MGLNYRTWPRNRNVHVNCERSSKRWRELSHPEVNELKIPPGSSLSWSPKVDVGGLNNNGLVGQPAALRIDYKLSVSTKTTYCGTAWHRYDLFTTRVLQAPAQQIGTERKRKTFNETRA